MVQAALPRFPGHYEPNVPLWGYQADNDPSVMAQKIDAAADHGIDHFLFDWYWYKVLQHTFFFLLHKLGVIIHPVDRGRKNASVRNADSHMFKQLTLRVAYTAERQQLETNGCGTHAAY